MTPGIHAKQVKNKTMMIEPHPRSATANGGIKMQIKALKIPMIVLFSLFVIITWVECGEFRGRCRFRRMEGDIR